MLKSETVAAECGVDLGSTVNGKLGVVKVISLFELAQEDRGDAGVVRGEQSDVKVFVCFRIDGGLQPVLLVIDANHGLVDGDLIRAATRIGL